MLEMLFSQLKLIKPWSIMKQRRKEFSLKLLLTTTRLSQLEKMLLLSLKRRKASPPSLISLMLQAKQFNPHLLLLQLNSQLLPKHLNNKELLRILIESLRVP